MGAKRNRLTALAGARGAADAVHICLRHMRQFEVHDVRNVVYVDAAGGDVCRDEDRQLAPAEAIEGPLALALAFVAVQSVNGNAGPGQRLGDFVGTALGAGEDDSALHLRLAQQRNEDAALVTARKMHDPLVDGLDRPRSRSDGDLYRLAHEIRGKLANLRRHSGGKQHSLPLVGNLGHDFADRRDEAHVQHMVRFVQHDLGGLAQADNAGRHVIQQAARRRNDDVDPARQAQGLRPRVGAADHHGMGDPHVSGITADVVADLDCQLAGWREDQRAAGLGRGPAVNRCQMLQYRQYERRCLAGPGLGDADKVASAQYRRDALGLDGSRLFVAFGHNGAK